MFGISLLLIYKLMAVVVFATPPLLFIKQITFPIYSSSISANIVIYFVKNSFKR